MTAATPRVFCALIAAASCLAGLTACPDRAPTGVSPLDSAFVELRITPPSLVMGVGTTIKLVATVSAGAAQRNRGVRWTSENTAVATVDSTGVVASISVGMTRIIATAAADPTMNAVAPVIVGSSEGTPVISAITQDGKAADPANISGRLDAAVVVPAGPPDYSMIALLLNCGGTDTVVATQSLAVGEAAAMSAEGSTAPITLSFNTTGFKNGPCILKVRATMTGGATAASPSLAITLNNPTAAATLLRAEHLRGPRLQRVKLLS
jgi:hypothetical protein